MILASCQCQHIFCCWVEPSLLLSSLYLAYHGSCWACQCLPGLEDLQITVAQLVPSPTRETSGNCIDSLLSTSCKTGEIMGTHAIKVQLGAEADVTSVTVYTPEDSGHGLPNYKVFNCPLLPEGSSLQVEILSFCHSVHRGEYFSEKPIFLHNPKNGPARESRDTLVPGQ